MSDVEDLAEPSAPKPAPAVNAQTETAPADQLSDKTGQLNPEAAPQRPDQTRPPEQASFDEDFPDRSADHDFDQDFPDRPAPEYRFSQMQGVPAGVDDPLLSTPMDPEEWRAYLNGSRIGKTMEIFGHAFTGPGMGDDVLKYGLVTPEEAQQQTDSFAQVILRPLAQMSRAFTAGFAFVPAAALDLITKAAGLLQDVAVNELPDKLGRDVAAAVDMELTWNGVVPGASLKGPREPILAPATRWERLYDMTTPKPEPVPEVSGAQAVRAEAWGQRRLAELNAKADGRADLKVSGPEGEASKTGTPGEYLTGIEALERRFLESNPHGSEIMQVYPGLRDFLDTPRAPRQMVEQRAEGVIGEPESNYMGTTAPTEAEEAARRAAAAEVPQEAEPQLTVDQVARQQEPELFREYDGLAQRRENLARWVRELRETTEARLEASPPAELRAVDEKIDSVRAQFANSGARSRVEAEQRFQDRLDALEAQRDDVLDDLVRRDQGMQLVTRDLQNTDYRMRDLAPEVSRAMREARDRVPGEPPAPVAERPPVAESRPVGAEPAPAATQVAETGPEAAGEASAPRPGQPVFEPPVAPPVIVDDAMRAWIEQDVATKLRAVGLSPEAAEANAKLVAHRYATRAQLHEGRQGSARELYERDFPHVRIGQRAKPKQRSRIRELAQQARQVLGGRRKTDTPEFREWFGDSKVVDQDGHPEVVYHGTPVKGIEAFEGGDSHWVGPDMNDVASTFHAFFSSSRDTARSYGRNVMPVYLSIKNPLEIDAKGAKWGEVVPFHYIGQALRDGHDGVIVRNIRDDASMGGEPGTTYIPLKPTQIKSIHNRGTFDANDLRILYQGADQPVFYSALTKAAEGIKQNKAPADQWVGILRGLKGVKPDEIEWSGVMDWLKEQQGPVTKDQLLDYLRSQEVDVQEVWKGDGNVDLSPEDVGLRESSRSGDEIRLDTASQGDYRIEREMDDGQPLFFVYRGDTNSLMGSSRSEEGAVAMLRDRLLGELATKATSGNRTRYSDYQLPGGQNYREMLLTLPYVAEEARALEAHKALGEASAKYDAAQRELQRFYMSVGHRPTSVEGVRLQKAIEEAGNAEAAARKAYEDAKAAAPRFRSSHWQEDNILAHVRMNDRVGPNGERILHVEEIQSDWHQKGRKDGYKLSREDQDRLMAESQAALEVLRDKLKAAGQEEWEPLHLNDTTIRGGAQRGWYSSEEAEKFISLRDAYNRAVSGNVPDAPLKNTEQWAGMAVKRILRYAAENGYDGVSWTTGEQQAARYGLERRFDGVGYMKRPDGTYDIWLKSRATARGSDYTLYTGRDASMPRLVEIPADKLDDYVGTELADKFRAGGGKQDGDLRVFEGEDLRFGGEGMKGFYDQMLPNVIKQVGKKAGARATTIDVPVTVERYSGPPAGTPFDDAPFQGEHPVGAKPETAKVHYVPLTEDLRELAGAPQPLWQKARDDAKGAYTLATPTSRAIIKVFDTHDASTFAHEMGHHFLEEMRADAALENAPEQIKRDMAAIENWLKLKPGQDVPTSAHEKWARGFERYLMEGRAPSRALAQVFERFREWLVGIYKTVANLKSNINPEIRDVYARLLAHPRDRVSIDPGLFDEGMYSTPGVLVKKTPGERADPVAAQLNRQTSEQAGVYARELVAELRGRSPDAADAAGGRAPQREGLPGGGAAAGDLGGEAPHLSEPRGSVPGRGDAAAEGFGPPRPVGQLGPNRRQGLYRRIPARPPSLADWLKARGGLKDTKGEVKALGVTKPGLIKAMGGEGLDDAALAAWENGFFPESPERPTIREFLEKLEHDLRGNHQWSEFDNDAVEAYRSAREHNAEVDRLAAELQIEAKGLTHGEFWDKVSDRLSAEQQARLVESQADAARDALEEAERLREESLADMPAGWEPPPELGAETRTLEDLENERRQEDAARGAIASGPDVRGPSGAPAGPSGLQEGPGSLGGGARDAGRDGAPGPAAGADRPAAPAGDLGLQPRAEATGADKRVATADQPFEELDPEVVDKAGNIRLENLSSDESVRRVLREYAERNGMFMDARRGVVTDADVLSFAEAMGVEASELNIDHLRKISLEDGIPLAARIQRGRQMLIESAQAVHRAMAGEDELAYLEASQRHLRIQETLSAVTAEWGRAGRAFRKSAEEAQKAQDLSSFLVEQTGKTLFQVQMEMKLGRKLSTPAQVSKTMREWAKPSNADKVVEVWINGLLSMPATHVANMTSNATMALTTIAETGIAAGIGKLRNAVTGSEDRVYFGEAMEQLFGIREGTMEGLRVAAEILKDGDLVNSLGLIEQARPGAIEGLPGKIVRAPGQLLGAEDAIFKAIAYRQKINQLAYRTARREGLEGQDMANRIASLKSTPTAEMMTDAVQFARYQTFQKPLGDIGRALQKAMATHPGFKFIVPFMRTPTNVAKYTLERSPLALLSLLPLKVGEEVGANLRGENGAIARDTQMARIALGSSILVAGYTLAAEGVLVGGRSNNQAQRQADQREGIVPYGIKLLGQWASMNRLGPIGFLMGVAADAWEIRHAATQKEQENWGAMAMASFITSMGNLASLRGPADFFKFMSSPERSFTSYTSGFVGSFVPSVVAGVGKAFDPYERETRNWIDRILARLPGARQLMLLPKVDLWGRDIDNDGRYGLDMVSPSRISPAVDDPVERELRRLEYFPTLPSDKIMGVKLTDQQLYEYRRLAGRLARQRVEALVKAPGWKDLQPDQQKKFLRDAFQDPKTGAHHQAQQAMMFKYQSPDPRNPRPDDIAAAARVQKKKLTEGYRERIKSKPAAQ